MYKFVRKRLFVSAVSALAAILATAGIAFAVWSVSGAGTGGGAATIAQSLVVTPITPTNPAAQIYPGGPAGPVFFTVANPNPFAVTITGLSWGTPTSNNVTTCPNADISLSPTAPTTVSISVPANAPAGAAYQISGVLVLAHSAPDGCQGVTFNVPLTVSAAQQ